MKNYTGSRSSHAVVITRAPRNVDASTPWGVFGISDPGYRRRFTLFDYDTAGPIRVRGHVTPAAALPLSPSSVGNGAEGNSVVAIDLRDFGVVIENGRGVLTDGLGRRLGQLAEADVEYKEIPNSSFDPFLEPGRLTDTLGGNDPPRGTSVGFSLGVDVASSYVLDVRAASTGQVSLMLHDDLSRRNIYVWNGVAGQTYRFALLYDPAPTARLIVQRTDAGAPRPYQLTALCGTRFRVRNRSDYTVTATWDVYGTTERGTLQLPPRASEAEFSETIFSTTARGTVRLFVGGQQVDVKAPSNASCAN